jgi:hypothetical protein
MYLKIISCYPEAFSLRKKMAEQGCKTCATDQQNNSGIGHKM